MLSGHVDLPLLPQRAHFPEGALEHLTVHPAQGIAVLQRPQHQATGLLPVTRQQGVQVAPGQGAQRSGVLFAGNGGGRLADARLGTAQQVVHGNVEEIGDLLQGRFAGETGALFVIGDGGLGHAQLRRQVLLAQLSLGPQLAQARSKISHAPSLTQFE